MYDSWIALGVSTAICCFTLFIISIVNDLLNSKKRKKEERKLLEEIFGNKQNN